MTQSFAPVQNALTHRDAKKKDKLELTWQAPTDFKGEIEFRYVKLIGQQVISHE